MTAPPPVDRDAKAFATIRLPSTVCKRLDRVLARDATFRSRSELVKHYVLQALVKEDA